MYYKTDLDREKLEYAHLAGFNCSGEGALIDGTLLIRHRSLWQPATIKEAQRLESAIAAGVVIREQWVSWIEGCRTS